LSLAMALNDSHYCLFTVLKTMVFILLCLLGISPAPHKGVALFLDSRLKPRHLSLPTGREFAGIRLWERWQELQTCLLCSSKQLLLHLKQDSVHVADCNSIVLCNARRALPGEENCLHSSSFNHLFAAAMKAALECVRSPCW
jgi:hypothetical protein